MPYEVRGKCIYKKDGGTKVGCTKGDVHKYMAALHANANESIDTTVDLQEYSKTLIKRLVRENLGHFDDIVTFAAVVSSRIREAILRQGFKRVSQQRSDDRFINEYKNGVGTTIITQAHWANDKLTVFFKLGSDEIRQMTLDEVDRLNSGYTNLFTKVMNDFVGKQQYSVEYHIDKL